MAVQRRFRSSGGRPTRDTATTRRGVCSSAALKERRMHSLGRSRPSWLTAAFAASSCPMNRDPTVPGRPRKRLMPTLTLPVALVFSTPADLEAGEDLFTRPNIGDEIGRARSKPHLRNRICILKEHGVTLPSNINPAYELLELEHPDEGFRRALAQLGVWGLGADRLAAVP